MIKLFDKLIRHKKETHPVCSAVVPAAGSSSRMGGENKLFLPLAGIPVLVRTLRDLDRSRFVDEIIVAVREEDLVTVAELCRNYGITKPVKVIRGGSCRLESVMAACLECRADAAFIAVHDGARPLAGADLIDRVIDRAFHTNAAAPAVEVKDTIKVVRNGVVVSTPERASLRAVQTPQVFDAQLLRAALQNASDSGAAVTDDCSAVERLGKDVYLVESSYENLKITTPEDVLLAEEILRRRGEF